MAIRKSFQRPRAGTSSNTSRRTLLVEVSQYLGKIFAGQSMDNALRAARSNPNRATIFEICYGTVRHYFSLTERLTPILNKSTTELDRPVWYLLISSAYQLQYMRVKTHALVSESVHACRLLGFSSASGLVNAVLRRYDPSHPLESVEARYECPRWLLEMTQRDFPDHWTFLLTASLTRAPVTLRVNRRVVSPREYRNRLREKKIEFKAGLYRESITLKQSVAQDSIPGLKEGHVAIQDAHSQIAVNLLNLQPGMRVLDACAAPGIKSMQMLDTQPDIKLLSIDVSARRSKIKLGNHTSHQTHRIQVADATQLDWWDKTPFDRILLDAPCSGTGTLRRNPDIKHHRNPADIESVADLQLRLLRNLWQTLAPHGQLLYCTCSVLSEENDAILEAFCKHNEGVKILPVEIPDGLPCTWGRQLLPKKDGGDGFYFALLERVGAST